MEQRRLITRVFFNHSSTCVQTKVKLTLEMSHYMIETYKRAVKKLEMDECSVKVISRHAPGSNSIMKEANC